MDMNLEATYNSEFSLKATCCSLILHSKERSIQFEIKKQRLPQVSCPHISLPTHKTGVPVSQ